MFVARVRTREIPRGPPPPPQSRTPPNLRHALASLRCRSGSVTSPGARPGGRGGAARALERLTAGRSGRRGRRPGRRRERGDADRRRGGGGGGRRGARRRRAAAHQRGTCRRRQQRRAGGGAARRRLDAAALGALHADVLHAALAVPVVGGDRLDLPHREHERLPGSSTWRNKGPPERTEDLWWILAFAMQQAACWLLSSWRRREVARQRARPRSHDEVELSICFLQLHALVGMVGGLALFVAGLLLAAQPMTEHHHPVQRVWLEVCTGLVGVSFLLPVVYYDASSSSRASSPCSPRSSPPRPATPPSAPVRAARPAVRRGGPRGADLHLRGAPRRRRGRRCRWRRGGGSGRRLERPAGRRAAAASATTTDGAEDDTTCCICFRRVRGRRDAAAAFTAGTPSTASASTVAEAPVEVPGVQAARA